MRAIIYRFSLFFFFSVIETEKAKFLKNKCLCMYTYTHIHTYVCTVPIYVFCEDLGGAPAADVLGVHGALAGRGKSGHSGMAEGYQQRPRTGRRQRNGGRQREGHRAGSPRRTAVRRHLHAS